MWRLIKPFHPRFWASVAQAFRAGAAGTEQEAKRHG